MTPYMVCEDCKQENYLSEDACRNCGHNVFLKMPEAGGNPTPSPALRIGPRCGECGEWCEMCQNGKNRVEGEAIASRQADPEYLALMDGLLANAIRRRYYHAAEARTEGEFAAEIEALWVKFRPILVARGGSQGQDGKGAT